MKINSIQYVTSSYKTTNPPISERSEICVQDNALGKKIVVTNECNSYKSTKEYNLTADEYNEIENVFNNYDIRRQIFELTERGPNPNFMPMCGGSSSEYFSFSTECVSASSNVVTEEMRSLIRFVNDIVARHGNPDFENSTGDMPGFGVMVK